LGGAPVDPTDPALPEGVQPLSGFITAAPDAMMRRLKQIGVVARADGARLVRDLKPGQRLVSQEGDLWRWDGYAVAAHAPTGAARRLAGRNRLADIETELRIVRADLYIRRESVTAAEAEVAATRDARMPLGRAGATCNTKLMLPEIATPPPNASLTASPRAAPHWPRHRQGSPPPWRKPTPLAPPRRPRERICRPPPTLNRG